MQQIDREGSSLTIVLHFYLINIENSLCFRHILGMKVTVPRPNLRERFSLRLGFLIL